MAPKITLTHSVDYSPQNLGTDWVEARCGEGVHITSYSSDPQCRECRVILLRERLKKLRLIDALLRNGIQSHKDAGGI